MAGSARKCFAGLDCPGYRLPTEAEWEYAARAGTTTPFWTGTNLTTDQANYNGKFPYAGHPKGTYRKKTVPVRSFDPNPLGLYEILGNVDEWMNEWIYADGRVADPTGFKRVSAAVLRGGSWSSNASDCRSASRHWGAPGYRNPRIGFRLARTLPSDF